MAAAAAAATPAATATAPTAAATTAIYGSPRHTRQWRSDLSQGPDYTLDSVNRICL